METKQKLWLIAQNLESDEQNFYTIDDWQFQYKWRLKELQGRRIHACLHGWVVLSDHLRTIYSDNIMWSLWNPLSFKFIHLPPLITKKKDGYECCLSSQPQVHGSKLLLFSLQIPTVFICRLGPKNKKLRWTKRSYAKQLQSLTGEVDFLLKNPASFNGKVYAIVLWSYKFVIQVDIVVKGKQVLITLVPIVSIPSNGLWSRCPSLNTINEMYPFLKGSCNELFYIEVGLSDRMWTKIAEVTLFKLDMTSKTWKQMVDLEDAVFFLEYGSGYSTCYYNSAVGSKLGGYIHVLGECGKTIYSFNVKDKTMSLSSLSCPVQASAWAMQEWRLKDDDAKKYKDKDTKMVVRTVKGEFDSASHLLNMPSHILELIMEFCIGVEYMKFRATCKQCRSAAPPIQWSNNKTWLRSYSLLSPWLIVLDNYRDIITFIDPMYGDKYFITTPQELKGGYEIYCSKYGWLLMYKNNGERRLVFFNPFTSAILELPDVRYMGNFCFTAPPTSPNCMVVGFSRGEPWHVFIHFVSGESRWHTHNLTNNPDLLQFKTDKYDFNFPTFSGRYIYALCNNERIEAFRDMTSNGYSWELVANIAPSRSRAQYFISNCDQHLLLIIIGEFGRSVEVYKLDKSTQEWETIDDLGKHMIFISISSCICLEAKTPEMGNKIYFPRLLRDEDTKIVFYSLETGRYHTFDENKKIQQTLGADLFGTKYLGHPHAWIEPSWS